MIPLRITLNGDGAFKDYGDKDITEGILTDIVALDKGMTHGRSSVMMRIVMPDGKVVICQTSMRLFLNAANLFGMKYGNQLEGDA